MRDDGPVWNRIALHINGFLRNRSTPVPVPRPGPPLACYSYLLVRPCPSLAQDRYQEDSRRSPRAIPSLGPDGHIRFFYRQIPICAVRGRPTPEVFSSHNLKAFYLFSYYPFGHSSTLACDVMLRSCNRLDHVLRSAYGSWIMVRNMGSKVLKERGNHSAINKGIDILETRSTKGIILNDPVDYVAPKWIIDNTTHRDGSIYRKSPGFLNLFEITNRDETPLEPMILSNPTDCGPNQQRCLRHFPNCMMQIFSLKLAQIPIGNNSVELYGYIAARDSQDNLLNYIVNRSRADPIVVQQGSLIEMIGPKRGISLDASVLLEFDMRIKNGEQEKDDLTLIDGASEFCELTSPSSLFTRRLNGECGAVDITLAAISRAVEATIEVDISKVQNGFSFSLNSFVFVYGLHEEIQLFHGIIHESCGLRRFVVAVDIDTWMHLKFKIGQKGSKTYLERHFSFEANKHGCMCQQVLLDLASISMKVTWSVLAF